MKSLPNTDRDDYRSLIAKLIRDGRQWALASLCLDALEQLPAQFALAAAEQEATGPGASTANRDFQVATLRELFAQVRAASRAPLDSEEDSGELLYQTNTRDRAEFARSQIVGLTTQWMGEGKPANDVRDVLLGILEDEAIGDAKSPTARRKLMDMTEPEIEALVSASAAAVEGVVAGRNVERPFYLLLLFDNPGIVRYSTNHLDRGTLSKALRQHADRIDSGEIA